MRKKANALAWALLDPSIDDLSMALWLRQGTGAGKRGGARYGAPALRSMTVDQFSEWRRKLFDCSNAETVKWDPLLETVFAPDWLEQDWRRLFARSLCSLHLTWLLDSAGTALPFDLRFLGVESQEEGPGRPGWVGDERLLLPPEAVRAWCDVLQTSARCAQETLTIECIPFRGQIGIQMALPPSCVLKVIDRDMDTYARFAETSVVRSAELPIALAAFSWAIGARPVCVLSTGALEFRELDEMRPRKRWVPVLPHGTPESAVALEKKVSTGIEATQFSTFVCPPGAPGDGRPEVPHVSIRRTKTFRSAATIAVGICWHKTLLLRCGDLRTRFHRQQAPSEQSDLYGCYWNYLRPNQRQLAFPELPRGVFVRFPYRHELSFWGLSALFEAVFGEERVRWRPLLEALRDLPGHSACVGILAGHLVDAAKARGLELIAVELTSEEGTDATRVIEEQHIARDVLREAQHLLSGSCVVQTFAAPSPTSHLLDAPDVAGSTVTTNMRGEYGVCRYALARGEGVDLSSVTEEGKKDLLRALAPWAGLGWTTLPCHEVFRPSRRSEALWVSAAYRTTPKVSGKSVVRGNVVRDSVVARLVINHVPRLVESQMKGQEPSTAEDLLKDILDPALRVSDYVRVTAALQAFWSDTVCEMQKADLAKLFTAHDMPTVASALAGVALRSPARPAAPAPTSPSSSSTSGRAAPHPLDDADASVLQTPRRKINKALDNMFGHAVDRDLRWRS